MKLVWILVFVLIALVGIAITGLVLASRKKYCLSAPILIAPLVVFNDATPLPKASCRHNWCLWKWNGEYRGLMRESKYCSCHFRGSPNDPQFNMLIDGPVEMTKDEIVQWKDNPHRQASGPFEDVRVFQLNSEEAFIFGTVYKPAKVQPFAKRVLMVDGYLDFGDLNSGIMESPKNRNVEKNWAFLAKGNDIYFVYSLAPLVVYAWKSSTDFSRVHSHPSDKLKTFIPHGELRNTTALFEDKDGTWIGLGHVCPKNKVYYHFFYWLAPDLSRVVAATPAFRLPSSGPKALEMAGVSEECKNVQFGMGLVVEPDRYVVSYNQGDMIPTLTVLNRSEIEKIKVYFK